MLIDFLSRLSERQLERFSSKIDVTKGHGPNGDCWIWRGSRWGVNSSIQSEGYGVFSASHAGKNKSVSVHRLMLFLVNRPFDEKLEVKHSCDNSICCNPHHLEPGTRQENNKETWKRNRMRKALRVSEAEKEKMVSLLGAGSSIEAIGKVMCRNRETVRRTLVKIGVYTAKATP